MTKKSFFSRYFLGWVIGFISATLGMILYEHDILIYYTVFIPLALCWAITGAYYKRGVVSRR